MRGLDPLLTPETVAVIGASRNPLKVGGSVIANLRSGKFGDCHCYAKDPAMWWLGDGCGNSTRSKW